MCRVLYRTIIALDNALKHEICWPSDKEFDDILLQVSAQFPEPFNKVGVIIDVTPLRISRSTDTTFQKESYNTYRHCHCLGVLIACTPDGRIVFSSNPTANPSDQAIWNSLHLREKFKDKKYAVMGDSGFTFNTKEAVHNDSGSRINSLSPYTRRYNHELTDEEKRFNHTLSTIRAVIENINAQVKKWRVFSGVYRHYSVKKHNTLPIEVVVRVVMKLTSRLITLHPIRKKMRKAEILWDDPLLQSHEK